MALLLRIHSPKTSWTSTVQFIERSASKGELAIAKYNGTRRLQELNQLKETTVQSSEMPFFAGFHRPNESKLISKISAHALRIPKTQVFNH